MAASLDLLWLTLRLRAIGIVGGALMALGLAAIQRDFGSVIYLIVLSDTLLSVMSLPAMWKAGWAAVLAHLSASTAWLALLWSVAPMLTRSLGL